MTSGMGQGCVPGDVLKGESQEWSEKQLPAVGKAIGRQFLARLDRLNRNGGGTGRGSPFSSARLGRSLHTVQAKITKGKYYPKNITQKN